MMFWNVPNLRSAGNRNQCSARSRFQSQLFRLQNSVCQIRTVVFYFLFLGSRLLFSNIIYLVKQQRNHIGHMYFLKEIRANLPNKFVIPKQISHTCSRTEEEILEFHDSGGQSDCSFRYRDILIVERSATFDDTKSSSASLFLYSNTQTKRMV